MFVYFNSVDSRYVKVEPRQMAEFAYDMHRFNTGSGNHGGWENYQAMKKADLAAGIHQVPDAWSRSFVPYDKQLEYARNWWDSESEPFRTAGSLDKKPWLDDALIDASNVYFEYEKVYKGAQGADWLDYRSAWLAGLISHQNKF